MWFCLHVCLSCLIFVTPWTTARQASLSITNSWSLPKPMSIESVMPSNHLILCCPLLILPSIFPSIRVFSNESALRMRWRKYWSFSFNISPPNEHPGLISFRMDWLDQRNKTKKWVTKSSGKNSSLGRTLHPKVTSGHHSTTPNLNWDTAFCSLSEHQTSKGFDF